MNDTDIRRILDAEKAWLATQPSMQPWDEGCSRVVALLEDCLCRYSQQIRECDPALADAEGRIYLARLGRCLVHHWHDATVVAVDEYAEAGHVAARIAAGQGYRRGGRLGGDPLRDVVLAVAMVRKDERATHVFQEDYYCLACALATKIHRRLAADPGPWWSELLDHLAGYTRPNAKLDKFYGQCGLRNWLGRVFWNFLRRWRFDGGEGPELEDPPAEPEPPHESLAIFAKVVGEAVAELSDDERLQLSLMYVDGVSNKQAAAILNIDEGTASRRHPKALSRWYASITRLAGIRLSQDAWLAVLEDMESSPRRFSLVLREALERGASDRSC
jgi:RNA polymerase sigma factor (sigma-70 family)